MQTDLPKEVFKKNKKSKIKTLSYLLLIFGSGFANTYFKIIKPEQLFFGLCFIMAIIFLCVDRLCQKDETIAKYKLIEKGLDNNLEKNRITAICKRDETIAKEKTLQKYIKYKINQPDLHKNTEETNDDKECKIYEVKRHKNKVQ